MRMRFGDDEGQRRLVSALLSQKAVAGDPLIAAALAKHATLVELAPGDVLIRQEEWDNDIDQPPSGGPQ